MEGIKYSICITHKNNVKTLRASLESILSQIDDSYEVVLVDSMSNDGSEAVLNDYAKAGKIKLFREKCSRGKGRQIAFEHSKGDLVIANIDMDEIYRQGIATIVSLLERHGDYLFLVNNSLKKEENQQNITIAGRELLKEIGGWRDINWGEDWDIWRRAASIGKFRRIVFPLITFKNLHEERNKYLNKIKYRFWAYRDMIKVGRHVFDEKEDASFTQKLIYALSQMTVRQRFDQDKLNNFDPFVPEYLMTDVFQD